MNGLIDKLIGRYMNINLIGIILMQIARQVYDRFFIQTDKQIDRIDNQIYRQINMH